MRKRDELCFAVYGKMVVEAHLPTRKGSILVGRYINSSSLRCKKCANIANASTIVREGRTSRLIVYFYALRPIKVTFLHVCRFFKFVSHKSDIGEMSFQAGEPLLYPYGGKYRDMECAGCSGDAREETGEQMF